MSNFHFNGTPDRTPDADLAAKRAAFQTLPPEQKAKLIAQVEQLRAVAAAVRARRVQAQAAHVIRTAQSGPTAQ